MRRSVIASHDMFSASCHSDSNDYVKDNVERATVTSVFTEFAM